MNNSESFSIDLTRIPVSNELKIRKLPVAKNNNIIVTAALFVFVKEGAAKQPIIRRRINNLFPEVVFIIEIIEIAKTIPKIHILEVTFIIFSLPRHTI
ncbi:TPA: hypothetical protein EYQ19_02855 [Candidatus Pacearchaeota archaeon]|nr:hypothetical protein [Candidatus Pacearchaeota archaeon]